MNKILKNLIPLSALILLVVSCSSHKKVKTETAAVDPAKSQAKLTLKEAQTRASRVSKIAYDLRLELDATQEIYKGEEFIQFNLSATDKDILIDFQGGKIQSLNINDKVISDLNYDGQKIVLKRGNLIRGENTVHLHFTAPYSTEGNGLYRFTDPEDKKSYVYTNFEPYDASRWIPCFDQPDLKGTLRLKVLVPKDWTMISVTKESQIEKVGKDKQLWTFPQTPAISTYIYALHGGPFKVWTSKAGDIPLRLFARQTLARYVDPEEWFSTTQQGLAFYNDYFAYPYPFVKYDQVIVPDFNAGAMENVAAVTFSERFISRGTKTTSEKEHLANVILHEMAHMWFGDLVTMQWWNDLWLNESFATYMASHTLQEATPFKKSWNSFFADEKGWGYWEDQLVTTHPIEADVPDTAQAFANFDGITYAKGASTMKQLAFYVGKDAFRDGMRNYFKKHQYKNTVRNDFIQAIAEAAKKDLSEWSRLWLTKAGVDSIKPVMTCQDGKIQSFELLQTAPKGEKEFRPHATQLGFYENKNGSVVLAKVIPISYQGAKTTLPELKGEKCPWLINPNEGDMDWVISNLDETTLSHVAEALPHLKDPFARLMFVNSLYEMVRTQELNVEEYGEIALKLIPNEKDDNVLQKLLTSIEGGRWGRENNVLFYMSRATPELEKRRAEFLQRAETLFWTMTQKQKPGSDLQKDFYDSYVRLVETNVGLAKIDQFLTGKAKIAGLKLDQDRRWRLVRKLVEYNYPSATERLAQEKKADPSESGEQWALEIEASQAKMEVKNQYLNTVVDETSKLSHSRKRSIIKGLLPPTQTEFRAKMSDRIYSLLNDLRDKRSDEFMSSFADLVPFYCDEKSIKLATQFLDSHSDLAPAISKPLKVGRQEDERCIGIRKKSATYQPKEQKKPPAITPAT